MENISGCNYAMRQIDTSQFERKKQNENIDWIDNAADAVQKVFNNTKDFSALFEDTDNS